MRYDPTKHHRRSIRLKAFDYSQTGAYFISVVTRNRECLFGNIANGQMNLNNAGRALWAVWKDLPLHYAAIGLDAFIVMPNHAHGIILLELGGTEGAGFKPAPTKAVVQHGLPEIVRGLKTFSARRVNEIGGTKIGPMWQRNYYEHVVRGEPELARIREYIRNNPLQWDLDQENPLRSANESLKTLESWEV